MPEYTVRVGGLLIPKALRGSLPLPCSSLPRQHASTF
jgi:hypothetical protein